MDVFFTKQFLNFITVGISAAFLHWFARYLLGYLFSFSTSVVLAYGFGILVAFILNRVFVFPSSTVPLGQQAYKFVIINLIMFPVVWGVSIFAESILMGLSISYSHSLAHGIAVLLPGMMTFVAYRFFTFK